jgi:hypothetical protein
MKHALLALVLTAIAPATLAQKWVDEKGKVYYGDPPPGVRVTRAPIKGGATSSVGAQGGTGGRSVSQEESDFQRRHANRQATQARDERDQRTMRHNEKVMENNSKVWQERYGDSKTWKK